MAHASSAVNRLSLNVHSSVIASWSQYGYHKNQIVQSSIMGTIPVTSCSLECHTLPQLPLLLPCLQLQSANSITQPLLLLSQLADLQLLQTAQSSSRRSTSTRCALSRCRALPACLRVGQSSFLQICFGDERLFATGHFVEMRFDAREEGVEFGFQRREEGLLCGLERWFRD